MLFQEYMWNYNKSTIRFQLKCMYYLIDAPCMDGLEMWLFQAVKSYVLSYYLFTLSIHTSMQAWANCTLKPDQGLGHILQYLILFYSLLRSWAACIGGSVWCKSN